MPNYTHPINKDLRRKRREAAFEKWKWHIAAALMLVSFVVGGWPW